MSSGLVGGQADGLEAFVGVLLRAFVVEARLAHGGDDDPVAREIDGVAVGLVHGGHVPPRKRAVQGIAGAFAFHDSDELLLARSCVIFRQRRLAEASARARTRTIRRNVPTCAPDAPETAQDGIGELAVHLDVAFAGQRVPVGCLGGASVAEQAAEDVGEEAGE